MSDSILTISNIQTIFDGSNYIRNMGLQALTVDGKSGVFSAKLPMAAGVERGVETNQFHGGAIAAFIDIVGDFAVGAIVGGGVPTMNLRIDYLRPGIGKYLIATSKVRKLGKAAAVVDIDVQDPDGKLVAVGRGTYVPITG